jgi:hypothetical protein
MKRDIRSGGAEVEARDKRKTKEEQEEEIFPAEERGSARNK